MQNPNELVISESELEVLRFFCEMKHSLKFNANCGGDNPDPTRMKYLLLSNGSLQSFLKLCERDTVEMLAGRGMKYTNAEEGHSSAPTSREINLRKL